MKVGVYISTLNRIGGVETFAINLCNRAGFDLIFNEADTNQIKKLNYNAYHIDYCWKEYDVLIIATAWGRNPVRIKAKKYVQMIHADYKAYIEGWNFIYKKLPYTTHHVAVGNHVDKQFELVTGYKADAVIYNLLTEEKINKPALDKEPLRLLTLSRVSKEKGFERMIKLADMLTIPFEWDIYGDCSTNYGKMIMPKTGKFNFKGVTTNSLSIIPNYHYLVQLSDTEGFPYSVYESLQCKTPVISTNYASSKELIKDGENGYIVDMELSNFDINKIKSVPLINEFKPKSTENDWFEFLESIIKK